VPPRLELGEGVTANACTMVVVPTLLTDCAVVDAQIERLEVHYLANPDDDATSGTAPRRYGRNRVLLFHP